MIQRRYRAGFPLESLTKAGVANLDGDCATESRVFGAKHLAHATRPELRLNRVRTQLRARFQMRRRCDCLSLSENRLPQQSQRIRPSEQGLGIAPQLRAGFRQQRLALARMLLHGVVKLFYFPKSLRRHGFVTSSISHPLYARFNPSTSIFFICSIAFMTRWDFVGSGSLNISFKARGTICHERPYLSLSQPHC